MEKIKTFSDDELFSVIYQAQKELLRRGINIKFEDLREENEKTSN